MEFLKILMILMVGILFIQVQGNHRQVRSATNCPWSLAGNFSEPRLSVYLTVNSLARVFWDGTFQKRRLELNWVKPLDVTEEDFVGLYRDDPQWVGTDNPLIRVPAGHPGGYYLTGVEFPDIDILHPALLSSPPRTMCLYNYWIAYVREGTPLKVNCVKIQPSWMEDMASVLGPFQLHSMLLPGTHNAGAYNKFTQYTDDNVMHRYSVNQGEDVWTQLLFGIRYLDLRVSYTNTPEKFWLVHDFVKHNPLYEAVHAVKRFLRITRELVIMDFHRFPEGMDREHPNYRERHQQLVEYIQEELGEFMAPDWLGRNRQTTLNDLWALNKTLIVTYQDDSIENLHHTLWPQVIHSWGNTNDRARLFRFLNRTMSQRRSATYLWVAMTHLTPSPMDVLWNLTGGIRVLNNDIARGVTKWYRDTWWQEANIVATDFFLSHDMVDTARDVNMRRSLCRRPN